MGRQGPELAVNLADIGRQDSEDILPPYRRVGNPGEIPPVYDIPPGYDRLCKLIRLLRLAGELLNVFGWNES